MVKQQKESIREADTLTLYDDGAVQAKIPMNLVKRNTVRPTHHTNCFVYVDCTVDFTMVIIVAIDSTTQTELKVKFDRGNNIINNNMYHG